MSSRVRVEVVPLDHGGPVDWPFEPFPESALDGSVVDRFEEVARRFANRTAVQDMARRLSYAELADLAARIAAATAGAAAGKEGPVALLLPTDARFFGAMLGVLAAGRAVVPLDSDHPAERNRLIADHAGATAVVSAGSWSDQARRLFETGLPIIDVDAMDEAPPAPVRRPGPDDLAYILYTSGSTGAPKGVSHSHRNGLHDTLQATDISHVGPEDAVAMVYSGVVVGGIRTALVTLLNGASLHIAPPHVLGAAGLAREIRARRITIFVAVPTLYRRLAAALEPGERLESVRIARMGGDRIEWSDIDAARQMFSPAVHVHAAVGSTECSSTYAQWFVDDALRAGTARLPVGRPLPNVSVAVLDEAGQAVPDGEVGEFVVSSRYLALGYWREPGLTAEAFRTDPSDPAVRIFRTGDMGLRRPDGLLEIVGRRDQLIKLRGHRIEPAEVERALRACPGVGDCAVVVRRGPSGAVRSLVAYVELEPGVKGLLSRHLRAMAGRVLPEYMQPSMIVVLDALPRLAILKIDRPALDRLDAARAAQAPGRLDDPLIDEVAKAFEHVLGCAGATAEDNLLSLGGDSLQAIEVTLALEDRLGAAPPLEVFRQSQSIAELAAWFAARRTAARAFLASQG